MTTDVKRSMVKLPSVELFLLDSQTTGPAIVCLHGRYGRAETWADLIQHYRHDYRIVAPDQRGHGLSGRPDSAYSDGELAGDVVELLNCLGIESAIVVGHSMGGAVAAHVAARHPSRVAGVAILDKSAAGPPAPTPIADGRERGPTEAWPLPFPTRAHASEHLRRVFSSELEQQYFMASLVETVAGYELMFSPDAMAAGVANYVTWYHLLPLLRCPVLLVRAGNREAVCDADFARMQELIPDCTAWEVAHPDHNVHLADKQQFYVAMDKFLARVRAQATPTFEREGAWSDGHSI